MVATALILMGTRPAAAQVGQSSFPNIRLKIGALFPNDSSIGSGTWIKLGADADLPAISLIPGLQSRVGIDYEWNGGSYVIPITYSEIWQAPLGPLYLGVGAGLYTGHLKGSGTESRIGVRFIAGTSLGHGAFLELNYDIVAHFSTGRVDGLSVMVGKSF